MSTLYIVPTPIGNLEDITLRALRVLREVKLIAAEDTRTSRKLLEHYEINTHLTSYHEHNKLTRSEMIFEILGQGDDIALISDAGTPGISDPGYELIQQAIAAGVNIVSLPGATAITTALVASGLPTDSFLYLGFLPRKYQAQRDLLVELQPLRYTLVFYESPNRLVESLHAVLEIMGDRQAVVAREITKFYEEFKRDFVSALIDYFTENPPRGEITLVIEGSIHDPDDWTETQVRKAMHDLLENGEKRSAAAKIVAEQSGWDRRDIYDLDI
ncbi:MAG TPA: 16S rRNA (cytidine(1402)-2'-O)-methyltransferase [Aggregatilineales bacterium]|nr:16S rRNA (cytidine(1402)-2'-O)-methyltransferase [Aggregatilineales bacterium]